MTKAVPHTEENVLGFAIVDGELIPFWEDNVPHDIELANNTIGKYMTSMTMAGSPKKKSSE
jgi:hypothetical protein